MEVSELTASWERFTNLITLSIWRGVSTSERVTRESLSRNIDASVLWAGLGQPLIIRAASEDRFSDWGIVRPGTGGLPPWLKNESEFDRKTYHTTIPVVS